MLFDGRWSICALYLIKMVMLMKETLAANSNCPTTCQCTSPNRVNCSASGITDTVFEQIDLRTTHLDISNNNLPQISEQLAFFESLIQLNASFNRIVTLHRQLFSRMHNLKSVDLSHNQIKKFYDINAISIFSSNAKLQFLNLSSNPITTFGNDDEDIIYSESLLELELSHCRLDFIQGSEVFLSLPSLQSVNLSNNFISRIDGFVSESLVSLDLSANNLQSLRSYAFNSLTRLRQLRVSNNKNMSDHHFKPFSSTLSLLDASFCSLFTIYASDLREIRTLILRGNLINAVAANTFENNTKLEYLDLSENRIRYIHEYAFQGADALRFLDLSSNPTSALPNTVFAVTPHLESVNLSNTDLNSFPNLTTPSLRLLDLSSSKLELWSPGSLLYTPNLQFLNLSHTYLQKLPENLTSSNLQFLDVSYSKLAKIGAHNLQKLPGLRELNLAGNVLHHIKNNSFSANNRLSSLILADNPWKCDCDSDNFYSFWHHLSQTNITNTSTLICQDPEHVIGWTWRDACSETWDLDGSKKSKDILIVSIIVGVLIVVGSIACVVAIRETLAHRRKRRGANEANDVNEGGEENGTLTEGADEREHTVRVTGEPTERGNEGAVRESIRKLTQLPSYDEALLLPKPESIDMPIDLSTKRQSATQTDESMLALMKQVEESQETATETLERIDRIENTISAETHSSPVKGHRKKSWDQIEYMNLKPLKFQCTEL